MSDTDDPDRSPDWSRALVLVGAGIIVVAAFASVLLLWLCGRDVIPRNRVVGIRLPALLASDAAWRAGIRRLSDRPVPELLSARSCSPFQRSDDPTPWWSPSWS